MACFDSGVMKFIKAIAIVEVQFPVDWHGRTEIACKHCDFFVRATNRCGLNQKVVNYPERYVGEYCPLGSVSEEGEGTCVNSEI